MNECFLLGNVVEVGDFKFILNSKNNHQSQMTIKIKLLNKSIITAVAYDKLADYILRNDFLNSVVLIQGKLRSKGKNLEIEIYHINKQ